MPVPDYRSTTDLPAQIPVFPLTGALLLPHAQLPLNIFEPRYLAMVDHAMAGDRVIGMIQPLESAGTSSDKPDLYSIGCAGRVTSYAETPDGRYIISLSGLARFEIARELPVRTPFRQVLAEYTGFARDLVPDRSAETVDRARLQASFTNFLKSQDLNADWREISKASTESLVNTFCVLGNLRGREMQALLEAPSLAERAEVLMALAEMAMKSGAGDGGGPTMQ